MITAQGAFTLLIFCHLSWLHAYLCMMAAYDNAFSGLAQSALDLIIMAMRVCTALVIMRLELIIVCA